MEKKQACECVMLPKFIHVLLCLAALNGMACAGEVKAADEKKQDVADADSKTKLRGHIKLWKKSDADADAATLAEIEQLKARAESGDAIAQYRLGLRCAKGQGVPKDEVEACKWLELSGDVQYLNSLKSHMTREEIADGKNRAEVFLLRYGKTK